MSSILRENLISGKTQKQKDTGQYKQVKVDVNQWWNEVQHRGLFISKPVLNELFPKGPKFIDSITAAKLHKKLTLFKNAELNPEATTKIRNKRLIQWIQAVLRNITIPSNSNWYEATLDIESKTESIDWKLKNSMERDIYDEKSNCFLLTNKTQGRKITFDNTQLIVYINKTGKRRGGKIRQTQSDFVHFLRTHKMKIGIFTNGHDFELIYAGVDRDAWIRWDTDTWFGTEISQQLSSSFFSLVSARKNKIDLLEIVEKSQQKQADLSITLGEQVRDAIELFLEGHSGNIESSRKLIEAALGTTWDVKTNLQPQQLDPIYQAATRIINRLIIILYAEARQLFPVNDLLYQNSYSLDQLFINLIEAEKEVDTELDDQFYTWKRIQGLFRLVYYGFENYEDFSFAAYGGDLFQPGNINSNDPILRVISVFESNDWEVSDLELLQILYKLKTTKISSGKLKGTTVLVDFLQLDTEYIGMIYEGTLDYQLKHVSEKDNGVLVLENKGETYFFPKNQIEQLNDKQIHERLSKVLVKGKKKKQTKKKSKEGHTPSSDHEKRFQQRVEQILIDHPQVKIRTYPVGRLYLTKWGSLRKGSGTYYTRPGLVTPVVEKALAPLTYTNQNNQSILKTPEDLLKLKIVDPAMGSGGFLIGCIRYLTQKMYESLLEYGRIRKEGGEIEIQLKSSIFIGDERTLSVTGDGTLDGRNNILNIIRPLIVNNCIYGVDINPYAVELAKIAIWLTTLDNKQPFKFLNHKLKVGNSLISAWSQQLYEYPINSFNRNLGIKKHKGINLKDKGETQALKQEKKYALEILKGVRHQLTEGQTSFPSGENIQTNLTVIHEKYWHLTNNINLKKSGWLDEEALRENYQKIREFKEFKQIKLAYDWWISLWFLPITSKDIEAVKKGVGRQSFERSLKSPKNLLHLDNLNEVLNSDDLYRIEQIIQSLRPFHWELEFPDVFLQENPGFDLVIGNPPWEAYAPKSDEFFANYDNTFRSLNKQEKLGLQKKLYERDSKIEKEWLRYKEQYYFFNNYRKENVDDLHIPTVHYYAHQNIGSTNLYKLFLERSYHLTRERGRVGIILPSGIYSDEGTKDLRKLLFDRTKWEVLFAFSNRKKIFPVHLSIKFAICIYEKGKQTEEIVTSFLRENISDLDAEFANLDYIFYQSKLDVQTFAPDNLRFLEITQKRDYEIMHRLRKQNVLVGANHQGEWKIGYKTEFHATGDSDKFIPTETLLKELNGFINSKILHTFGIIQDTRNSQIYLPVMKGALINIGHIRFQANYIHDEVHNTSIPYSWLIPSQYYMGQNEAIKRIGDSKIKIVFRNISSSTNSRTMITAIIPNFPCENSLPIAKMQITDENVLLIAVFFQSFVYDYYLRRCMTGSNVNLFIFKNTLLPPLSKVECEDKILALAANLNLNAPIFCKYWIANKSVLDPPIKYWALTYHEQLRLQIILNAISAYYYSLSVVEYEYILRNDPSNITGFFRVDKEKNEEHRFPQLCIKAYQELKKRGVSNFLLSDWQLPEGIQDVLGPRFLNWQLEMTHGEAWSYLNQYSAELDNLLRS